MRRPGLSCLIVAAACASLAGCGDGGLSAEERDVVASLALSSLPPIPADPSNRFADDVRAAALGEEIFFDTRLSADGAVACATCHLPERQFQDDRPLGVGLSTTRRRTMPLAGVGWSAFQFWDGRADSLWSQALGPIEDPAEHGLTRLELVRLVASHHATAYEAVFGPLPDLSGLPRQAGPKGDEAARAAWDALAPDLRESVDRAFANIGKAIAAHLRTLPVYETRFDRFAAAIDGDKPPAADAALTPLELEGLRLFIGKANCIDCHNGPRFTDDHFHNTGVPPVEGLPPDRGRIDAIEELLADPFNCLGPFSDADPSECRELRFLVTEGEELVRAYKTASLRGAASRPPYMHAGQIATLDEVVDHYSRAPDPVEGHTELRGVIFTDRGRAALVAFLRTLDPLSAP